MSSRCRRIRLASRHTASRRSGCSRLFGGAVTLTVAAVLARSDWLLAARSRERARAGLFLGIVLATSAVALVRLHATGGYLSARHALVPGMILTLAAASGLTWLASRIFDSWSMAGAGARAAPAGTGRLGFAYCPAGDHRRTSSRRGRFLPGPFSVYRTTGHWLAEHARADEQVLDLTDWSLYFSQRSGYRFADVYRAPKDPKTRWIVVREPDFEGDWHCNQVVRELIGGREAVALFPPHAGPNQMQIRIYDRWTPASVAATLADPPGAASRRR